MPSEKFNVIATTTDAMATRRNRNLNNPSVVTLYGVSADANDVVGLEIGNVVALAAGTMNLQATAGPQVPEDLMSQGPGAANDTVVVPATIAVAGPSRLLVVIEPVA